MGANPAHPLDGGIPSGFHFEHCWPAASDVHRWLERLSSHQCAVKTLKLVVVMVVFCVLAIAASNAQDLAAFKIPDSPRQFVFMVRLPSQNGPSVHSTNSAPRGVEGFETILAKGFKTAPHPAGVLITFMDALICRAQRFKGENEGGSVIVVDGMPMLYPPGTSVLVHGRSILLSELSERTFDPPTTFNKTYEGEEATKKLKEMGLEPPEDMDWKKATNK